MINRIFKKDSIWFLAKQMVNEFMHIVCNNNFEISGVVKAIWKGDASGSLDSDISDSTGIDFDQQRLIHTHDCTSVN